MLDIKDYLTQMAVGMTDGKSIYEAKWGKVKKKRKKVSSHANFHHIDLELTEDDLP